MLIIMRFCENNVLGPKHIVYINFQGLAGLHGPPYIFCLLNIKTEKVQEHDTGKLMNCFCNPTMHMCHDKLINQLRECVWMCVLLFLYKVSIVVLIDFIAILLTPGFFLIHIVNTNNANMYLINFHSKNNIKISFPKCRVFKVSNPLQTFIIHRNTVK